MNTEKNQEEFIKILKYLQIFKFMLQSFGKSILFQQIFQYVVQKYSKYYSNNICTYLNILFLNALKQYLIQGVFVVLESRKFSYSCVRSVSELHVLEIFKSKYLSTEQCYIQQFKDMVEIIKKISLNLRLMLKIVKHF